MSHWSDNLDRQTADELAWVLEMAADKLDGRDVTLTARAIADRARRALAGAGYTSEEEEE